MTKEALTAYTNRITNANPTQLIVIMYDLAIDYMQSAVRSYEEKELLDFRSSLKAARRVINNLTSVLDMKYFISGELMRIYLFINNAITRANARYETDELVRCIHILEKLRKSFEEVSRQDGRKPMLENVQQVYAGLTYSRDSLNEVMEQDYNRGFMV